MKIHDIRWQSYTWEGTVEDFDPNWTTMFGYVGSECIFVINKKGKKNPTFTLQSVPVRNANFNPRMMYAPANNTKVLGKSHNLFELHDLATKKLSDYVGIYIEYVHKPYFSLSESNRYEYLKDFLFNGALFVVEDIQRTDEWTEWNELLEKRNLYYRVKRDIENGKAAKQV